MSQSQEVQHVFFDVDYPTRPRKWLTTGKPFEVVRTNVVVSLRNVNERRGLVHEVITFQHFVKMRGD